jgi:hypothetical protein
MSICGSFNFVLSQDRGDLLHLIGLRLSITPRLQIDDFDNVGSGKNLMAAGSRFLCEALMREHRTEIIEIDICIRYPQSLARGSD